MSSFRPAGERGWRTTMSTLGTNAVNRRLREKARKSPLRSRDT